MLSAQKWQDFDTKSTAVAVRPRADLSGSGNGFPTSRCSRDAGRVVKAVISFFTAKPITTQAATITATLAALFNSM
jgi:hypothetical protein